MRTKDEFGTWQVEPAELHRVFPPVQLPPQAPKQCLVTQALMPQQMPWLPSSAPSLSICGSDRDQGREHGAAGMPCQQRLSSATGARRSPCQRRRKCALPPHLALAAVDGVGRGCTMAKPKPTPYPKPPRPPPEPPRPQPGL